MKNFNKMGLQTPINDRFYIENTHCFNHLGHFAQSNRKLDPKDLSSNNKKDHDNSEADDDEIQDDGNQDRETMKKARRRNIILGDDLGSD